MTGFTILTGLLSALGVGFYLGFLWGRAFGTSSPDGNRDADAFAWRHGEQENDLLTEASRTRLPRNPSEGTHELRSEQTNIIRMKQVDQYQENRGSFYSHKRPNELPEHATANRPPICSTAISDNRRPSQCHEGMKTR